MRFRIVFPLVALEWYLYQIRDALGWLYLPVAIYLSGAFVLAVELSRCTTKETPMPKPDRPDLDALERLLEAATPGPWSRQRVYGCKRIYQKHNARREPFACTDGLEDEKQDAANADLIVAMRNNWRALLDEVEGLRAKLEKAEAGRLELIRQLDDALGDTDELANALTAEAVARGLDAWKRAHPGETTYPGTEALTVWMTNVYAELRSARERLRFYADEGNYDIGGCEVTADGGDKARAHFAEFGEKEDDDARA